MFSFIDVLHKLLSCVNLITSKKMVLILFLLKQHRWLKIFFTLIQSPGGQPRRKEGTSSKMAPFVVSTRNMRSV